MVAEHWRQERIWRRTVEEIVDMLVPQIQERVDKVVTLPELEQVEGGSKKTYDDSMTIGVLARRRTSPRCWCPAKVSVLRSCRRRPLSLTQMVTKASALFQERIEEEIIDVAVPQVMKECVEVVQHMPQERIQKCPVMHIVDVPVPRIGEATEGMIKLIPQGRTSHRVVEQIVDALVRQMREQIVGSNGGRPGVACSGQNRGGNFDDVPNSRLGEHTTLQR